MGIYAAQNKQDFLFAVKVQTSGNPLARYPSLDRQMNAGRIFLISTMMISLILLTPMKRWDFKIHLVVIDTNHDNSSKRYLEQVTYCTSDLGLTVIGMKKSISLHVVMIESYLERWSSGHTRFMENQLLTHVLVGTILSN